MNQNLRLTQEIESTLLEQGADLVGVAPVERLEGAPKGYGPRDYMPEAKSVISIALHLADGVCDVWGEYSEPGKSIGPYLFYGYGLTNLELGRIANLAAKRLEYLGYKSLVFPPTCTVSVYRWRALRDGEMKADFSRRHAAVAAGLGELGWKGLVLTPTFGARVRFNSIISDAPLLPSPMYQGPAICQPERCRYLCARVCPAQALPMEKVKEVHIGEQCFRYSHIDMFGFYPWLTQKGIGRKAKAKFSLYTDELQDRVWAEEGTGVIASLEDFQRFPWPKTEELVRKGALEYLARGNGKAKEDPRIGQLRGEKARVEEALKELAIENTLLRKK